MLAMKCGWAKSGFAKMPMGWPVRKDPQARTNIRKRMDHAH
jgi:hypothetical protein